jgi:hypothetical protein
MPCQHRNRFPHIHLALNAEYSAEPAIKEGTTDGTKYSPLVNKMVVRKGPGGANAQQIISVSGKELQVAELNFVMGLFNQPGHWGPGVGAHVTHITSASNFPAMDLQI